MPLSTTYAPAPLQARTGQGAALTNREDLSNELAMLAPESTPLLSLCSKGNAKASFTEWNTDKLGAVNTGGISEGSDITVFKDKFAARARLGNYVQIYQEPWMVTNIQNAVTQAAPADAAAAEAKAILDQKRNIEATLCSANEMTVENGAGTPYAMRGLGKWIQATAQATNPVPADYLTPAGSILSAAPTEITFNGVIASIFSKNGEVNSLTCIANVVLRKVIANFTRTEGTTTAKAYNINQDANARKIMLSVTLFDSDFGLVSIVNGNPDCMANASNAAAGEGLIVNPKYLGFNTLIPMGSNRLQNQGGGERGWIESVGTLVCKHPQAHGKISY